MAARDAFTGQTFKLARWWVEQEPAKWCILSGLHGFLWPDTLINHYDQKMEPFNERDWLASDAINQRQHGRLRMPRRVIVNASGGLSWLNEVRSRRRE